MSGSELAGARIVITGRGVVSAAGCSVDAFATSLKTGTGGIARYDDLMPGQSVHVGLVGDFGDAFAEPKAGDLVSGLDRVSPEGCDRTARLAGAAALQALREAGLWNGALTMNGQDVALMLGTSHGGRSQIDRFVLAGMDTGDEALARGVLDLGAHYHQTAVVAALLGVHGPVATLSTACSSSGTAIAHGIDLLRAGQVRAVVAGGADAFSRLTLAGFQALGAVADGACGPFGSRIGISLGEGAAFVVLERYDDAKARGAEPLAELFGCATTWDAHHLTAPEPSGDGMRRAIQGALAMAGMAPGTIDYINAHGTGTRANDIAETLAIKRVFPADQPPVSASKSFTGHTLGASSATGLLAGVAGTRAGWLPPTLNFGGARPGCDLDYVADTAKVADIGHFLSLSAAFGGCNCAIVAGEVASGGGVSTAAACDSIVVTGLGVMSPLGCEPDTAFAAAFAAAPHWSADAETVAVHGFDPKRHLPRGRAPRMNQITRLSVAAIEQALSAAGLPPGRRKPEAIGLLVGLSRGAASSFETCMESVRGGAWAKASPIAFPHLVMSSVGGQVSVAVGLKGAASTMVGEADVGIALLGHAATLLARRPDLDALVILAADELAPLFLQLGRTAYARPFVPLAEGAVALVLERRTVAEARGARPLAAIAGWAQSFDAPCGPVSIDPHGTWLEQAVRAAVGRGGITPEQVGVALTLARGETQMDQREAAALRRVFGNAVPPISALSGHAGHGEASGGLLAVAMAIMALRQGRVPAPAPRLGARLGGTWLMEPAEGDYETALVAGSSRYGSNAALLLQRADQP